MEKEDEEDMVTSFLFQNSICCHPSSDESNVLCRTPHQRMDDIPSPYRGYG